MDDKTLELYLGFDGKDIFYMWVTSEAQRSEEFSFMLSEVASRRNNIGLCVSMYQFP